MRRQNMPVFLNLLQIRFPVTAIVSILHRLSGVLLFIIIPIAIYALQLSLSSPTGFETVMGWLDSILFRLFFLVCLWALVHHFFAGIRFLLLDIDIGISRPASRRSAWLVNILSLVIAALLAGLIQ